MPSHLITKEQRVDAEPDQVTGRSSGAALLGDDFCNFSVAPQAGSGPLERQIGVEAVVCGEIGEECPDQGGGCCTGRCGSDYTPISFATRSPGNIAKATSNVRVSIRRGRASASSVTSLVPVTLPAFSAQPTRAVPPPAIAPANVRLHGFICVPPCSPVDTSCASGETCCPGLTCENRLGSFFCTAVVECSDTDCSVTADCCSGICCGGICADISCCASIRIRNVLCPPGTRATSKASATRMRRPRLPPSRRLRPRRRLRPTRRPSRPPRRRARHQPRAQAQPRRQPPPRLQRRPPMPRRPTRAQRRPGRRSQVHYHERARPADITIPPAVGWPGPLSSLAAQPCSPPTRSGR